jgi:hypothetical protein
MKKTNTIITKLYFTTLPLFCFLLSLLFIIKIPCFIVLIKKWQLSIDAFPETIFVHLFENEFTFRYSPTQQKYYCQF